MAATLDAQMSGWWSLADDLKSGAAQEDALKPTVKTVGDSALDEIESKIGRDGRLSNYKSARAKVDTTVNGDTATIKFVPAGLWALVDQGAGRHRIVSTKPMPIGSGRFRTGPFSHPGMGPLGDPTDVEDEIGTEFDKNMTDVCDRKVL